MIRKLSALLLLLCAAGQALAANPSFGAHGMLLFGGHDALYASHLPMFHAPHDYQVILQVRLADKAQDAALRARLHGGAELWTLDPEKFDLDRFAPGAAGNQCFRADVVLGHFEQGGTSQHRLAGVIVEKVLYFRQLTAAPSRSAVARYLQLGEGAQRFLVKQIDSRPDFDHVLAVRARKGVRGGAVLLAKDGLQPPLASAIKQALPGLQVARTVYFSAEDLR